MKSVLPRWLTFDSQHLEAHWTLHHVHITLIQGLYGNQFLIPFFRRKISSPPTSTSSWSPQCYCYCCNFCFNAVVFCHTDNFPSVSTVQ